MRQVANLLPEDQAQDLEERMSSRAGEKAEQEEKVQKQKQEQEQEQKVQGRSRSKSGSRRLTVWGPRRA